MRYFSFFPKVNYSLNDGQNYNTVTNLMKRVKFIDDVKNNALMYYDYQIADGERPEVLAHRIYGDAEKHWIILYLNDIISIREQWPLSYEEFKNYVIDTYGSIATAKSTVNAYYKIETTTILNSDDTKRIVKTQVDAETYSNLTEVTETRDASNFSYTYNLQKTSESKYDYENTLNEAKRSIKLLKPNYIDVVNRNFIELINE